MAALQEGSEAILAANIQFMNELTGFDVVVICTGLETQAKYWMDRLNNAKGWVISDDTMVLAVHEDWAGSGAGNALGTLYAWQNACALAQKLHGIDLSAKLEAKEISVGLYHTAGKGTRLAPLPGSENNNKPGVKLPVTKEGRALTILEAVIKQTGTYGPSRKGRLSVFWGDQVFIPSVPVSYDPTHHADILCTLGPMPDAKAWVEKGLDKYGLIAVNEAEDAAQVEKVDHATATKLLAGLGEVKSVGASMGSFSVSHALVTALVEEFAAELAGKEKTLDTDPHLWMPMTLSEQSYVDMMKQKGEDEEGSRIYHQRIAAFLAKFWELPGAKDLKLFGAVDVGSSCYWWDYGLLKLFGTNNLLLVANSDEAGMLRKFIGMPEDRRVDVTAASDVSLDEASTICSSNLGAGSVVQGSVLCNVRCKSLEMKSAIAINVTAKKIVLGEGSILYNVTDTSDEGITLKAGEVLVGVHSETGVQKLMKSELKIDGKDFWKKKVHENYATFEEVMKANFTVDVAAAEKASRAAADEAWKKMQ